MHPMLQEVKSLNTRLIAFMKQHEQVEALIMLIVKQAGGGSDSEGSSPRNQQPVPLQQQLIRPRKLPRTACEVGASTGVTLVRATASVMWVAAPESAAAPHCKRRATCRWRCTKTLLHLTPTLKRPLSCKCTPGSLRPVCLQQCSPSQALGGAQTVACSHKCWLVLQVFCCEPESIIGTLIESPELMDLLFSFLQSPKPLDCTLAGYWARVLQILLVKRSGDVYGFCRSESWCLLPHMEAFMQWPLQQRWGCACATAGQMRGSVFASGCSKLPGIIRWRCAISRVTGMYMFAADAGCMGSTDAEQA